MFLTCLICLIFSDFSCIAKYWNCDDIKLLIFNLGAIHPQNYYSYDSTTRLYRMSIRRPWSSKLKMWQMIKIERGLQGSKIIEGSPRKGIPQAWRKCKGTLLLLLLLCGLERWECYEKCGGECSMEHCGMSHSSRYDGGRLFSVFLLWER